MGKNLLVDDFIQGIVAMDFELGRALKLLYSLDDESIILGSVDHGNCPRHRVIFQVVIENVLAALDQKIKWRAFGHDKISILEFLIISPWGHHLQNLELSIALIFGV